MTSLRLDGEENRQSFFQGCVERMLLYWRDHQALASIDITVLDRERPRILKNIALGLELQPLWPLVKPLVIAFAPYMERRGHWDAWHAVLEQAIRMAQRAGDVESETTLTAFLARVCQRMSRYDEVVRYYRRVIRLAKVTGNRFEEARACSNLGYYYIDGGRWWRSEVLSCHALAIFEELESDHGRAHTHNHLGLLYTRERRWEEAERHLLKACDIWEQINDLNGLMNGYGNLGLLYLDMEKPNDVIKYSSNACNLANELGAQAHVGGYLMNIGMAYYYMDDFSNAKAYVLKGEQIFKSFGNTLGLAQVCHNLGVIAVAENELTSSNAYFQQSLAYYRAHGNIDGQMKVLENIIEKELASKSYNDAHKAITEFETFITNHATPIQYRHIERRLKNHHQSLAKLNLNSDGD